MLFQALFSQGAAESLPNHLLESAKQKNQVKVVVVVVNTGLTVVEVVPAIRKWLIAN